MKYYNISNNIITLNGTTDRIRQIFTNENTTEKNFLKSLIIEQKPIFIAIGIILGVCILLILFQKLTKEKKK